MLFSYMEQKTVLQNSKFVAGFNKLYITSIITLVLKVKCKVREEDDMTCGPTAFANTSEHNWHS
jgi:hypothetical protein